MATISTFRNASGISYAAGETILMEGEPGNLMYVIVSGEVDVNMQGRHVATLGAGSVIGELAFFDQLPRSATVVARSACAVAPIDQQYFQFLSDYTPFFTTQLLQVLVERLRRQHAGQSLKTACATTINGME